MRTMRISIFITPKIMFYGLSILIIMAISWSVFFFPLYTSQEYNDIWEHLAAIQEWKTNLWNPGNPHLADNTGSPRYMPFFFLLTVLANIFDLKPLTVLAIGGVISIIIILEGVWLFLRSYFREDCAPLIGLFVLFMGWGAGWVWSIIYQLRSLFFVITYPSSFVFGLSLISFWLTVKTLRERGSKFVNSIALMGLSALMFVCHPPTCTFAVGLIFIMSLLEPNIPLSYRLMVIASVFMGLFISELWPYFSVWRLILGPMSGENQSWIAAGKIMKSSAHDHPFYNPLYVFLTTFPSWLGIPVMKYIIKRREHLFIFAGFLAMILPYFANLIFPIPLGHRFLFFAIFYLHLALIWAILERVKKRDLMEHIQMLIASKNTKSIKN